MTGRAAARALMTSFLASGAAGGAAERDGSGHADPDFASCTSRPMLRGRPLALLLSQAASRYGVTLSQKATLQSVPLIGAASGAVLNAAFLDQYKSVALAHFRLRQLERTHEFRKFRN